MRSELSSSAVLRSGGAVAPGEEGGSIERTFQARGFVWPLVLLRPCSSEYSTGCRQYVSV